MNLILMAGYHAHINCFKSSTNISHGGLKYINIGSGMHERSFYDKSIPSINDIRSRDNYAVVAIRSFFDYFKNIPDEQKPLLITEPGTMLVKDCIDFIATVKTIKCNQDEMYIVTNGSKFNLGTELYFDHRPILIVNSALSTKHKFNDASIVGILVWKVINCLFGLAVNLVYRITLFLEMLAHIQV